jgi:GT2 family glycosyltransferase
MVALEDRLGIVIITHDRALRFIDTLGQLRSLEASYPMVVVDNASKDGTPKLVRALPGDRDNRAE